MSSEERCGFLTLDDLHKWFTNSELDALKDMGFHAVRVRGKLTRIGRKQVIFIPVDCIPHLVYELGIAA